MKRVSRLLRGLKLNRMRVLDSASQPAQAGKPRGLCAASRDDRVRILHRRLGRRAAGTGSSARIGRAPGSGD